MMNGYDAPTFEIYCDDTHLENLTRPHDSPDYRKGGRCWRRGSTPMLKASVRGSGASVKTSPCASRAVSDTTCGATSAVSRCRSATNGYDRSSTPPTLPACIRCPWPHCLLDCDAAGQSRGSCSTGKSAAVSPPARDVSPCLEESHGPPICGRRSSPRRAGALSRYRSPDDPELLAAKRDLAAEMLAEHVERVVRNWDR